MDTKSDVGVNCNQQFITIRIRVAHSNDSGFNDTKMNVQNAVGSLFT